MINKWIFDFVYSMAALDALRRTPALNNDRNLLERISKSGEIKAVVWKYADNIVSGKNEPDFYECEEKLEQVIQDSNFTFGNAQKLINMTMKYLYIYYHDKYNTSFSKCHAPMDGMMRDHVSRLYREKTGNYLGISNVAWSTIRREDATAYSKFQEAVVEITKDNGLLPIEVDYVLWGRDNISLEEFNGIKFYIQ